MKNKDRHNYLGFSPAHSYAYSHMAIAMAYLKANYSNKPIDPASKTGLNIKLIITDLQKLLDTIMKE